MNEKQIIDWLHEDDDKKPEVLSIKEVDEI
jgi:hypothetical protein